MEDQNLCIICNIEKPSNMFMKNIKKRNGLDSYCKECRRQYKKNYDRKNKERINKYIKEWRLKNKEKVKKYYDNRKKNK